MDWRTATHPSRQMAHPEGGQAIEPIQERPRRVILGRAIEEFLGYLRAVRRRAPSTIDAYGRDLKAFVQFLGDAGSLCVDDVTAADIHRWIASMEGSAPATVARRLCSLSAFFQSGVTLGYAVANPAREVERPRTPHRIMPPLSDTDVNRLLAATRKPIEKAMLLTLATTGARRSELTGIRVSDVDLERRRIRIDGKGGKAREVIITPELIGPLYARIHGGGLAHDGYLFPSRTGRRFHNSTLQRWFTRWVRDAGLNGKGFTIHSLRRYAATRWLRHGLSIRDIQVLLGHESLETTARYLNVDLAQVQERIEALPPVGEQSLDSAASMSRHATTRWSPQASQESSMYEI